jgi:hypothetical protein
MGFVKQVYQHINGPVMMCNRKQGHYSGRADVYWPRYFLENTDMNSTV